MEAEVNSEMAYCQSVFNSVKKCTTTKLLAVSIQTSLTFAWLALSFHTQNVIQTPSKVHNQVEQECFCLPVQQRQENVMQVVSQFISCKKKYSNWEN